MFDPPPSVCAVQLPCIFFVRRLQIDVPALHLQARRPSGEPADHIFINIIAILELIPLLRVVMSMGDHDPRPQTIDFLHGYVGVLKSCVGMQ